jgi:hypothetical protein
MAFADEEQAVEIVVMFCRMPKYVATFSAASALSNKPI